jgi:hypothetical protein
VAVLETEPQPSDFTETGLVAGEQERLSADLDALREYASRQHADFASIRWENGPRVRVVVGLTNRFEEHCQAMRAIAKFPDEFEIVWQPYTEEQLTAIRSSIEISAAGRLRAIGFGAGVIHVSLRADAIDLAAELADEYPGALELQVGLLPFPAAELPPWYDCSEPMSRLVSESPLRVTARIDSPVHPGDDLRGGATVTNKSEEMVVFDSGDPATAVVVLAGTQTIVAMFDGAVGGVGAGGELLPGASKELGIVGGTASCDPDLGYALPPGDYEVIVLVDQYAYPNDEFQLSYLASDPVPLTVEP